MKIVYFVDGLNNGGVESIVCYLSSNFLKLGNQVYIICLYEDMDNLHSVLPDNISIYYLPFKSYKNHLVNYIRYLPNLVSILKKINPDIVHAHNSSFSYFFLSLGVLLSRTAPVNIRSIHFCGFFLERNSVGDKIRYLFDRVASTILKATIISVGPAVSAIITKLYPKNKHYTIINGIDTKERFSRKNISKVELGIRNDQVVAVYVARICAGKNHDTLIKAWEIVSHYYPSALLILIGDGPLKEHVQNIVLIKKIEKNVLFTGFISNVEEYLSIADIGVFPSVSEGLGLGLIEMMSIGLPVVASKIPAFLNIINDNVNGILYETNDYRDLANKIIGVLSNKEKKNELGENARLLARNYYSIENMINKHNILYKELLLK